MLFQACREIFCAIKSRNIQKIKGKIQMEKIRNWKQDFYTIWAGQAVSLITSGVLQMAIIWHLTNTTGSAMVLSMATLVGFLPQAVLGSAIGVLVDRWNRKMVMIGADVIIACAGLVLTVISLSAELPVWIVMLILFIRSVGTAFHSPALSAVTPLLVPEEQLVKCAGYTQSIQSASFILSPAIAAFLYAKWGLNSAVALDVFGAIIACITVAMVHIPKQPIEALQQENFFTELRIGYNAIRQNKALFTLLWIGAINMFIYMPINALFPLMSMNYFEGSTLHASVVEIVFAVGMLLGGLLLGAWGGFKKPINVQHIANIIKPLVGSKPETVNDTPTRKIEPMIFAMRFLKPPHAPNRSPPNNIPTAKTISTTEACKVLPSK
jgi:DHA3 family macrolide efflux protein-like MFS transporter